MNYKILWPLIRYSCIKKQGEGSLIFDWIPRRLLIRYLLSPSINFQKEEQYFKTGFMDLTLKNWYGSVFQSS